MKRYLALTGLALMMCALATAQESGGQRVVVPSRNSTRPRQLKVNSLHASVTVRTHTGNDVIVETSGLPQRRGRDSEPAPAGMHRIDLPPGGFAVEEEDNVISINAGAASGGNINVLVPVATSVQVKAVHGAVKIDGVHGEVDASSTNGPVQVTNVSGTIVAETVNGPITASMDRVDPAKPISFSSTNGPVEVTLPADLKANLKIRSFNGSIWSDFDMRMTGGAAPITEPGGAQGKFRVKFDRTVQATINGGGVEASFSTLNGRIMIKKK